MRPVLLFEAWRSLWLRSRCAHVFSETEAQDLKLGFMAGS
jgi:hypothetical protein